MKLEIKHFVQLSPVFIASFMLMSSMFNGDVKAFIWLFLSIVGIVLMMLLSQTSLFHVDTSYAVGDNCADPLLPLFTNFPKLSVSTFFIVFTLTYLIQPMMMNKDWNYYVIVGFLGILIMDTMVKFQLFKSCTAPNGVGILSGTVFGIIYSILCYNIILVAGGDKLLYFNTVSSNNVYCSKPKKQTFKCYVYKNGQIISAV